MRQGNKVTEYLNSFFKEMVIESFKSDINPDLEVAVINGRYQLNAGRVNYSFGPLHDAFRKYFHKDPPAISDRSKVLLLGFGAGSVANILRQELNIKSHITGVEVDKAVIEAARKHFALDKVADIDIIISDAYSFIEKCNETYDLVVIDLYIDDKVPEKFETREFIQLVADCLNPGGKVVFNKLQAINSSETKVQLLMDYFMTVFDTTEVVKVFINKDSPNWFIVGVNEL